MKTNIEEFISSHNQVVLGSSPSGTTFKIKPYRDVGLFYFYDKLRGKTNRALNFILFNEILYYFFRFNILGVATVLNPIWSDPESKETPIFAEILKLAQ